MLLPLSRPIGASETRTQVLHPFVDGHPAEEAKLLQTATAMRTPQMTRLTARTNTAKNKVCHNSNLKLA